MTEFEKCSQCITTYWRHVNAGEFVKAYQTPPCVTECSAKLKETAKLIAQKQK